MKSERSRDLADPAAVEYIASLPADETGYRNRLITSSYFEIGRRLRRRLGHHNADWATSAAWASGAVGLIIRDEERDTSRVLRLARMIGRDRYDRILGGARQNLAEGNRQVYSELGLAFANLARDFTDDRTEKTDDEEEDFLSRLPQTNRSVPVEFRGDTDLAPAFRLYLRALKLGDKSADDRKKKSELIFAANVMVTASEQAGLQPFLDAAFQPIAREVAHSVEPLGSLPFVRGGVQVIGYAAQALGQRVITEYGIRVVIGNEALRVGRSIRPHNGRLWAPDLEVLTDDDALRVYKKFSKRCDGRRSSAADWTVMVDRMNYITNFFRSRQQDPVLQLIPPAARQA